MHNPNFRVLLCAAVIALALGAAPLRAQKRGISVDRVHPGSMLIALVDVPVRDRAPGGGALYVKGDQKGSLSPSEVIIVNEEQIVRTLLGDQKWVSFSRSKKVSPPTGWVLVGNTGATSSVFDEKN